jgi:2Fe-2S ferredoxin
MGERTYDREPAPDRALCRLTFLPGPIPITARRGDTILDAALENGVELAHECGGNCACTTCHVWVQAGSENLSPMEEAEDDRLRDAEGRTSASRLACQALLQGGDVTVLIPETSEGW